MEQTRKRNLRMGIYQSRNFRVGIYERHLLSTNTEVDGRYTTTEVLGIRI